MDIIPVLSQIKSLVQVTCGQKEEALRTQENFSRQCPIISQLRSLGEVVAGDKDAAERTQIEFGHCMLSLMNGLPIVGHVKGCVHYALKDNEGGDLAMKAASHTTLVVTGGIGGMMVAGPLGSVAGGMAAGTVTDLTITGVDSAIKKEFKPYGFLEVSKDVKDAGKWVDAIGGVVLDGVVGRAAGGLFQEISSVPSVEEFTSATSRSAKAAKLSLVPFRIQSNLAGLLVKLIKLSEEVVVSIFKNGKLVGIFKDHIKKLLCPEQFKTYPKRENSPCKGNSPCKEDESTPGDNGIRAPVVKVKSARVTMKVKNGALHIYVNDNLEYLAFEGKLHHIKESEPMELNGNHAYSIQSNGLPAQVVDEDVNKFLESKIRDALKSCESNLACLENGSVQVLDLESEPQDLINFENTDDVEAGLSYSDDLRALNLNVV